MFPTRGKKATSGCCNGKHMYDHKASYNVFLNITLYLVLLVYYFHKRNILQHRPIAH